VEEVLEELPMTQINLDTEEDSTERREVVNSEPSSDMGKH
jgi:hypothetical protein